MLPARRLLVAVAFLGSACTPSTIAPQYAQYSGCPEEKVDVSPAGKEGQYRASGCGNGTTFRCKETEECKSALIVVAERHAKQFRCTPQQAKVEDLGGDTYIARGCGQQATYQCFADREYVVRCITESTELNIGKN